MAAEKLRGLQPLPAWQAETRLRGLHRLPAGKLKRKCATCKSRLAEQPVAPEIKPEPEVKLGPIKPSQIKQEPFTIRGASAFATATYTTERRKRFVASLVDRL